MDGFTRRLLACAGQDDQVRRLHALAEEFCHTIRNRLNCLKLSLYLARRTGPDSLVPELAGLERQYLGLETLVERFEAFCRPPQPAPMPVRLGAVLAGRRGVWADWLSKRSRSLEWHPPATEGDVLLDPGLLGTSLDDLVRWRAEQGREGEPVEVLWQTAGGVARFVWLERSEGGADAPADCTPSLAIPWIARIAALHGGKLLVDDAAGLRVELRVPCYVRQAASA